MINLINSTKEDNKSFMLFLEFPMDSSSESLKMIYNDYWMDTNQIQLQQTPQRPDFINIDVLVHFRLKNPISVIVEPDEDQYIVKPVDIPIYATGDDPQEAIDNLKEEIEILNEELQEDDNFSDEWLQIKNFLKEIIIPVHA